MIILYIILIILALILCVALFTKLTLMVKVVKPSEGNFKSDIHLKVLGTDVDLSSFANEDKPEKPKGKPDKQMKKKPLRERINNLAVNIQRGRYTYLLSKRYVRKKVKIEKLDFSMTFGLDDAAHTGIATGAAWGGVYNVFGFADRLFTIKSHNFNITPVFDGECFALEFEAMLKFSLSNIIAITFAVFMNYMKSKIKIRKG